MSGRAGAAGRFPFLEFFDGYRMNPYSEASNSSRDPSGQSGNAEAMVHQVLQQKDPTLWVLFCNSLDCVVSRGTCENPDFFVNPHSITATPRMTSALSMPAILRKQTCDSRWVLLKKRGRSFARSPFIHAVWGAYSPLCSKRYPKPYTLPAHTVDL